MKQYDCVFSLGEACFIATHLKNNGLRMFSGPFDWMYGSNFKTRCDILVSKFENYFNKEDLEFKEYRESNKMVTYRNKRTNLHYNHDFHSDLPFDYEYYFVKEKYDRRINRLLQKIANSEKVLICYGDLANTTTGAKSDAEIVECVKKLNEVYAPTRIEMLYVKHNPQMKSGEVTFKSLNEHITIAETTTITGIPGVKEDCTKSMKAVLKFIKKPKENRFCISNILNKFYKVKENNKGIKIKFCGITIFKLKKPLILEYYKKKFVFEQKENVQTIVLGSSHANRGINSMFMKQPTVNLATTSQDLYQSYHMLEYALKNCSTIKNVILFYAPFSSGFNISRSSEKYRTAFMEIVFGIKPFQKDKNIPKKAFKKPAKYFFKDFTFKSDNNPLFKNENYDEETVKQRAQKHIEFAKNNSMNEYLIKIINLAKEKNINLHIAVPPYTKMYKKYISADIFNSLETICNEHKITYLSFYEDKDFEDNDFSDSDHLNIFGSIKLTNKINKFIGAEK